MQQPTHQVAPEEQPARVVPAEEPTRRDEGGKGSELVLSTCHDAEQLVCAGGSLFLVTDRHGDIVPRGARELGLFFRDTRHLSFLSLQMENAELVHLSAETSHDAYNQIDLMVSGLDEGEFLDDPQNFLHVRRRQLLDDLLVEEVTFTNFLGRAVEIRVRVSFDVDFADIFEVRGAKRPRRGQKQTPVLHESTVHFAYLGLDDVLYTTDLTISPPPRLLAEDCVELTLRIAAGGTERMEISVRPGRQHVELPALRSFAARVNHLVEDSIQFRAESTRVLCDNALIQQFLDQGVIDLHSLQVRVADENIVAAGIPWFCAPFGRDSLIASYEALLLNPELAKGSLAVLAAFQGKRYDEETEEEPGKIFHELRFGEMARAKEMPHTPYYGTIDATPLFVIVTHATYKVTADHAWLQKLLPNVLAALAWIDRQSDNGKSFVAYQRRSPRGLDNQGWKDSKAGVSFPERRAGRASDRAVRDPGLLRGCLRSRRAHPACTRSARAFRAVREPRQPATRARRGRVLAR